MFRPDDARPMMKITIGEGAIVPARNVVVRWRAGEPAQCSTEPERRAHQRTVRRRAETD